MPTQGKVSIRIFNLIGQEVKNLVNRRLSSGVYEVDWDGTTNSGATAPSGIYLYTMEASSVRITRRLLFLK